MRQTLTKLRARLGEFFLAPSDGRVLAAIRIVIALSILVEAVGVLPHLDELYGQYGFLQADIIEFLTGVAIPGFLARHGVEPAVFAQIFRVFFAVHVLAAFLTVIGFKTRPSVIVLWITQAFLLNCGYFSSYGVDRYFMNFLFLMCFFPMGDEWSLDRWLSGRPSEPKSAQTIGLRLMQIFMALAYYDAGISKSHGQDWWNGEAIWRVLNQPGFRQYDFLWIADFPWLAKVLCWGTLILETFYGLFAWIPRVGPAWILAIISLHLGIAAFMGLTLFGVCMAALNAGLFLLPLYLKAHRKLQSQKTNAVQQDGAGVAYVS